MGSSSLIQTYLPLRKMALISKTLGIDPSEKSKEPIEVPLNLHPSQVNLVGEILTNEFEKENSPERKWEIMKVLDLLDESTRGK